jgi:hypothetical protein
LVRRWEWLIDMPNDGCFPQTSHTAAMTRTSAEQADRGTSKISIAPA